MTEETPGSGDAMPALVQAASALVLRACADGVEVLTVRRHRNQRFLGGYWVFPGGALDPADAATSIIGEKPVESGPSPALRVAAARELFEETGLLLSAHGDRPRTTTPEPASTQRQQISRGKTPGDFAELLRRRSEAIDLQSFKPWAHWITPSALRRRFDTWFFVAAAPAGQVLQVDGAEIDDARWVRPVEWAFGARVTDFPITPPTQLMLRELAHEIGACGSLDKLLATAGGRSVPVVLPKLVGGEAGDVVLPWDPAYNELPGEGSPWETAAIATRSGWPSRLPAKVGKALVIPVTSEATRTGR